MTQNLFTLFPRTLNLFMNFPRCIVVVVFILKQQCNDGNREISHTSRFVD